MKKMENSENKGNGGTKDMENGENKEAGGTTTMRKRRRRTKREKARAQWETTGRLQCRYCHRLLPLSEFERFRTGTYRHVCRRCRWVFFQSPARRKRISQKEI